MIVQQFLPLVRLNDYDLASDVAGVPDLSGRIKPILSSLVPEQRAGRAVAELKPRARRIVTDWVLISIPLLALVLLFLASGTYIAARVVRDDAHNATGARPAAAAPGASASSAASVFGVKRLGHA